MSQVRYCAETMCIRQIFAPNIYCDRHRDNASTPTLTEEAILMFWKEDILACFMPKCSFCGIKSRKVVGQLPKGVSAMNSNSRPVNWGYYCQRCYDEGTQRENEAMYG